MNVYTHIDIYVLIDIYINEYKSVHKCKFCVYILYIYASFFFKISVFSKTLSLSTSLVQGPPAGITLHGGSEWFQETQLPAPEYQAQSSDHPLQGQHLPSKQSCLLPQAPESSEPVEEEENVFVERY